MITKPSIWDYKYDKMNAQETMLNYDRDMMIYEQMVSLQKLNGQQDIGTSLSVMLTPCDKEDILPCGKFRKDSKEYKYYEKLRLQRL